MTNDITNRELVPELGPAMRVLSERWRRVVYAAFETKGDRSAALRLAGYKGKPESIWQMASRLFADDRVRAAIREECERRVDYTEPAILQTVQQIMLDPSEKAADRLRAAAMWWDRARPVEQKLKVNVEHHLSHDERDLIHYRAMKKLGMAQDAFLARFGVNGLPRIEALAAADDAKTKTIEGEAQVIDIEYTEIDPSPEVTGDYDEEVFG